MSATLATITPVNRRLYAYTTGAVTALGIDNRGEFATRVNLGGALLDIIPPGTSRTYPLGNVTGFGGWVVLCPVRSQATISELARLGTQIVLTTYGGADTIPYGSATQPGELAASADDLATVDIVLGALYRRQFDARTFGAVLTGTVDDTAPLQACLTAAGISGGGTVTLAGLAGISAPLAMASQGVRLLGTSRIGSGLRGLPSFSGAAFVTITANDCGVEGMRLDFGSGTSATNPAATGIQLTAARNVILQDLEFTLLNGYCIEVLGSASVSPFGSYGAMVSKIHCNSVAGGIHTQGFSAGSWAVQGWFTDINLEGVDGPLDAFLIEDSFDVLIENINGAVGQGSNTNSYFHVKGNTASVYVSNPDVGFFPGPASAPVVLIESGANGSPKGVKFVGGVLQGGTYCVQATAGQDLYFIGVTFARAATIGASMESAASYVVFEGCLFNNNGQTAGAARYDLQVSNASIRTVVQGCFFRTAIGSSSGQVNASCNFIGSNRVYFTNNEMESAAGVIANAFNGSVLPALLKDNINVNPVGQVTVTVGASPYSVPTKPYPVTYYVTGGTISANGLSVGGVALTGLLSPATVRVPPNTAFTITYSVAPTVTGFGE